MFNSFIAEQKTQDEFIINGTSCVFKTDFILWVKLICASQMEKIEETHYTLSQIFFNGIPDEDISNKIREWIGKYNTTKQKKNQKKINIIVFDFVQDNEAIFSELWHFYPELMKKNISFHQGMSLIYRIIEKGHEHSELSKRVFARTVNLADLPKSHRKYWNKLKLMYRIKRKRTEFEQQEMINDALDGIM